MSDSSYHAQPSPAVSSQFWKSLQLESGLGDGVGSDTGDGVGDGVSFGVEPDEGETGLPPPQ